jgi:hypothetical protein
MALRKSALSAAMVMAIMSASPAAFAQSADPVVNGLVSSLETALKALVGVNGGPPSDLQIQQQLSTTLALSTASVTQKEAALEIVETAALAAGSTLPLGTAGDVQLAYAAISGAGGATASGGGAEGGSGFGGGGLGLGGGGGGSSYTPSTPS